MKIFEYSFESPYILTQTTFNNVPAVYVVYSIMNSKTVWLDVGETDKLGDRLSNHERKNCWVSNAQGNEVYVGVIQISDEFTRKNTEADLRNRLLPICGEK